ncbi:MAG: bifunctional 1-(5-phosphoribosyl)-5-((5-phosphoribosylamino)methylideneamino)imidazole-4-carboxamide isomerase/phosphoribosylanthranilate isomerase PriA, partial [Marmoricola sp.]
CDGSYRPVVSSGGISELADLESLLGVFCDGFVGENIGTALYEDRFTLTEALDLTRGRPGSGRPPR